MNGLYASTAPGLSVLVRRVLKARRGVVTVVFRRLASIGCL